MRQPILAQDRILGGTCVFKVAPAGSGSAEELATEGDLLGDLAHPRLVKLADRFQDVEGFWDLGRVTGFATRWVDGLPLTEALLAATLARRIEVLGQLLDVVGYLHRRGVLHLDLKPANALLTDGGLVLLDLGSARPLDAGPGEAGGTLGYAAPEVLAGHAASVAADIYSLGAVFYELLADQSPFGALGGVDLRRAAMAGDILPLRAVAPSAPYELSRLAERMLAQDPAARPRSVPEILGQLEAAGFPVPVSLGMPPFAGRDRERAALRGLLQRAGGCSVAVVGPPGSGRARLVRRVLRELVDDGSLPWLDLTQGDDLLRAIEGLAMAGGEDLPDRADRAAWLQATTAAVRAARGQPCRIFLGRREAVGLDVLRLVDALVPAFVEAGNQVVWASDAPVAGAETLHVQPLRAEEIRELGRYFGVVSATRLQRLVEQAGGWPDTLVMMLAPGQRDIALPSAEVADSLALLAALPPGIPRAFVERLPDELGRSIQDLVAARAVHWAADGRLYVNQLGERRVPLIADVLDIVEPLAETEAGREDALWFGLALARGQRLEPARALFALATGRAAINRALLAEYAERLADSGHRTAVTVLAAIREDEGDMERAVALLRSLDGRSVQEDVSLVRVLRRAGRAEEAEALARECLERAPSALLWIELARLCHAADRTDEAARCCHAAEELDPATRDGEALSIRVQIALRRLESGQPDPDTKALMERVERQAEAPHMSSLTLSAAGRTLARLGELERGERLLGKAAERADQEGDDLRSAGIRLNRGNALQRLGKGRRAREAYLEALLLAERIGASQIILRLRYSLADLELRAGRLPSAETHIVAFQAEAQRSEEIDVVARGAELMARLSLARGRPEKALTTLAGLDPEKLPLDLRISRDTVLAQACLQVGRAPEALTTLVSTPEPKVATSRALVRALRARAHFAVARDLLREARELVPAEPDPLERFETGEVLLATAGEDLDPDTFVQRRKDLDQAARLLRGAGAGRAATLRDRLLEGPGAALEGIVALTEAMNDPQAFPGALARLVSEALGAYRVLIMVGIPGLGTQMRWSSLSGREVAGISDEVLRRIRNADDYWLAHNAFADPLLRETSQTVRTFELKSLLAVAIPRGDKACGALYVDDLHRSNRFGPQDVAMLQRLARAVGEMLPLLNVSDRGRTLADPQEILGVLLSDPGDVEDIEYTLSLLGPERSRNLLVTGETGVGKTWFARRLATERLGANGLETVVLRPGDPQMLVTQLTGARKGEYTGALDRAGAIQRCLAHGRVLFLDEVQNLNEEMQTILLPLLELPDRHFGGLSEGSDFLGGRLHVILGTNVDVSHGRWQEHFRPDLWYRMSGTHIHLPPLADRGAEVVYQYLARMFSQLGAPAPETLTETRALHWITTRTWPGNLRQLQSFAERAVQRWGAIGRPLNLEEVERCAVAFEGATPGPMTGTLDKAMKDHVMTVLRRVDYVQKEAAVQLGMSPATLNKYLKREGLQDEVKRLRRRSRD